MNHKIVAPSLLAADFRNLENEFKKINASNSEWLHFDVMDGNNVPNISFGFPILKAVRELTELYIDVHMMVDQPSRYFQEFKEYGANGLTIPSENNWQLQEDITAIQSLGLKAGLAINPSTSIESIMEYLPELDLILVMSVFPGFGGQKFIADTYKRVEYLRKIIDENDYKALIEVDGGVNIENAPKLRACGADVLVSGSSLFQSEDFSDYVLKLQ